MTVPMAYSSDNSQALAWAVTMSLRLVPGRACTDAPILQQMWLCETGETEWRAVPYEANP